MKLGIIGAMDVEVASIKEKMNVTNTVKKARMTFVEGTIGKTDVVVVKCGIGKVNAGMCVQILADLFNVDAVLNTGIAGSLNDQIDIGDIVVADSVVYHDVDVMNFGYEIGEMPGVGMRFFPADKELSERAAEAIKEVTDVKVFRGIVASGDQFIREQSVKDRIVSNFGAYCAEMESTAIGHAATLNNIPFVIIRAISDKANEEAAVTYEEFEGKAARDCANTVFRFVESLGE